ncbi:hypothetical protein F5887DRAFT_826713, partial [Amanita rubescens]
LHSGKTGSRLKRLPLAINMPVMVTTNIDLNGGVVNGSIGTVRKIYYHLLPNGDRVLDCCIIHIPSAHSAPMPGLASNEFPIMPDTV